MLEQRAEGAGVSKSLKSVRIGTESECSCKSDVCRSLPISVEAVKSLQHAFHLIVQPLKAERGDPIGDVQGRYVGEVSSAWKSRAVVDHFGVPFVVIFRVGEDHLRYDFFVAVEYTFVGMTYDVKDDVVVCGVELMSVPIPIGGVDVNFDISHPRLVVDDDFRIEEVRTGIVVMQPGVEDDDS